MITALEAKKNADDVNFGDGTYKKVIEEINDMISGLSKKGVYSANFLLDERTIGCKFAIMKILKNEGYKIYDIILQDGNNLLIKWS